MSVNENGNLRPDGMSRSLPIPFGRIGGTYYWYPGSPPPPATGLAGLIQDYLRNGPGARR
jgi:hypothetical protein